MTEDSNIKIDFFKLSILDISKNIIKTINSIINYLAEDYNKYEKSLLQLDKLILFLKDDDKLIYIGIILILISLLLLIN